MTIFLDFETRSRASIKSRGGRNYVADDSTSLLCGVAYDTEADHVYVWSPYGPFCDGSKHSDGRPCDTGLGGFAHTLALDSDDPPGSMPLGQPFVAHNAEGFDRHVWEALGYPEVTWLDSLPRVRRAGYPAALSALGDYLYETPKDKAGQLCTKLSWEPQKKTGEFLDPDGCRLSAIVRYCLTDVLVLAQAWSDLRLGDPHPDDEVLRIHKVINERGVRVDQVAAQRIQRAAREVRDAAVASAPASLGDRPAVRLKALRSPVALCKWLKAQGVRTYGGFAVDDVTEPSVRRLLARFPDGDVGDALRARLAVATVTEGKVAAALGLVSDDGRLRGTTAYYAAHTGRWGGRGYQVQNLPRPEELPVDVWDEGAPLLRSSTRDSAALLQSMLRGVLIGDPWLVICDLDQIEYRVMRWLAGDEAALLSVAGGCDPYQTQADRMGVTRQQAKVTELACGYQGGVGALQVWADKYDLDVGDDLQAKVETWRDANPLVAGTWTGSMWTPPADEDHDAGDPVKVRKGGLWRGYKAAAFAAVESGADTEVGRVRWHMVSGDLRGTLPSGRWLLYREARVEWVDDRWGGQTKALCFTDAKGGRDSTYGGKLAENCFGRGTQVVTRRGIIPIEQVTGRDMVWDGDEWVKTSGAVIQGEQQVGAWCGVHVTADHLILAGRRWTSATELDGGSTREALSLGRDSAPWSSSRLASATGASLRASAIAEWTSRLITGHCGEVRTNVRPAGTETDAHETRTSSLSSLTPAYARFGATDTAGSWLDATTRRTRHTRTTAGEGWACGGSGATTATSSCATPKHCHGGTCSGSTSTESTTPATTSPVTCDSSAVARTPATAGQHGSWTTGGSGSLTPSSWSGSALAGVEAQPLTTSTAGAQPNGLWTDTGERSVVFDLLNCGPRSRFMIVTAMGPAIVHNCAQAVARDVMAWQLVRLEDAGLRPVLHVHDEAVCETDRVDEVTEIMCQAPEWASGLPVAAKAELAERYGK